MAKKYTVKSGDTLSKIGAKYGVSVPELAKANGIINPNIIKVGQVLIIPEGGDTLLRDALEACIAKVEQLPEFKILCDLL